MEIDLTKELKNENNNTTREDLNEFLRLLGKNVRFYSRVSGDIMRELILEKIRKYSDEFYKNTTDKKITSVDFERVEIWFKVERDYNRDTFLKELLDQELLKFKNFFVVNKKTKKIK